MHVLLELEGQVHLTGDHVDKEVTFAVSAQLKLCQEIDRNVLQSHNGLFPDARWQAHNNVLPDLDWRTVPIAFSSS